MGMQNFLQEEWKNKSGKTAFITFLSITALVLILAIVPNIVLNGYEGKFESGSVNNLSFNFFTQTISADEININSPSGNIKIPETEVKGINLVKLAFGSASIESVVINNASLNLNEAKKESGKKDSASSDQSLISIIKQSIPERLKPLSISAVDANNLIIISNGDTSRLSIKIENVLVDNEEPDRKLTIADEFIISSDKINFPFPNSSYKLKADSFFISSASSELLIKNFSYSPFVSDQQLFRQAKYGIDRYIFKSPSIEINGLDLSGIFKNRIKVQSIDLGKAVIDVLTLKYKPDSPGNPKMPHQILSGINLNFNIDTMNVTGGRISVGEQFEYNPKPAYLFWENVNISFSNLNNDSSLQRKSPSKVFAAGNFYGKGKMNLSITYPLFSNSFDVYYSGSVAPMDAKELNHFIEISEKVKISEGKGEGITFNVDVRNGSANGEIIPKYSNLKVSVVGKDQKRGVLDAVKTFFANVVKVKDDNPNDDGLRKGTVNYRKKPSEAFFEFLWIALREALMPVLGL